VAGVLERDPAAIEAFYDRHSTHATRVLARILGPEPELADLQHEVFVRALSSMDALKDPSSVKAWLGGIAANTAKRYLQRRARGRWLRFFSPDELPEVEASNVSEDVNEALRATYWALDRLPADERIAFVLRVIDDMELTEIAATCGTSLSTVKRRLARAEAQFLAIASKHPVLSAWIEGGTRWDATADR
jgi:RNA polymerase sigma-70 factor (ECF subfamily)